jgi:hypothetical protein
VVAASLKSPITSFLEQIGLIWPIIVNQSENLLDAARAFFYIKGLNGEGKPCLLYFWVPAPCN